MRIFLLVVSFILLESCGKPTHQYQGYVEGENIYLAAPFSGALIKRFVHRGEHVKKGQLLFVLDPNPQTFAIDQAQQLLEQGVQTLINLKKPKRQPEIAALEAKVEQAKAEISLAKLRVKRNTVLFSKHYMDKDTLDAAVTHLHENEALLAEYTANLELAHLGDRKHQIIAQSAFVHSLMAQLKGVQWNEQEKNIYAPDDGVIVDTYYQRGEFVSAERPVASLLTPENTHIEFFVPLKALAGLHVGKAMAFTYEAITSTHHAVISYISPEAEYMPPLVYSRDNAEKIVFRIKAQVDDGDRLVPGEPVIVFIEPDHA